MKNDLISVIVITYNIENYVRKCLRSIIKQSYKNIEILVVDDGSKDKTVEIINQLAIGDSRIKIIQKENGGPSSARNQGLRLAKGKYVVFVDGDDYVADDYIEYLYNLVVRNNSDFAMSKNLFSSKKQAQIEKDHIQVLTPAQVTALLLSTRVVVGSYNKIYKLSFLRKNKIEFNESLFYGEGLSFITTVAQLTNNACIGERRVYFYRKNNIGSATTAFNIKKIQNGEKSILLIKKHLSIKDKMVYDMITLHLAVYYLGAAVNLINHHQKKVYNTEYKKWMHYVRTHLLGLLCNSNVSLYRKMMLLGGSVFPSLIARLDIIRRKRIIENSFS